MICRKAEDWARLGREGILLDCGRRRPQLMGNPLGGGVEGSTL
jgi:hypothetical protein